MVNRLLCALFMLLLASLPSMGQAQNIEPNEGECGSLVAICLEDEFMTGAVSSGTIGHLGWFTTGGTISNISELNEPGIIRKDTSAVSGTTSSLLLSGTQGNISYLNSRSVIWRARLNTNDANTTIRIGESNGCTVSPVSSGAYFERLDGETNWFAVTRNAGVQTRTDTGVAAGTDFAYFSYINNVGTSYSFFINDVLVATHTTNIFPGFTSPCAQITNSTAAAKTFDVGYFKATIDVQR